jgi:hypothetical protein
VSDLQTAPRNSNFLVRFLPQSKLLRIGCYVLLWIVTLPAAIVVAVIILLFYAIFGIMSFFPNKYQRRHRNAWREFRRQNRTINWEEAKNRVLAGNGTFLVRSAPSFTSKLWWIAASRQTIDPNGTMPSWAPEWRGLPSLKRADRQRLEEMIGSALWIPLRNGRTRADVLETISTLPTIEIDVQVSWAIITGESSDPIHPPAGDPAIDALSAERDRLHDLMDSLVGDAEYQKATQIKDQLKAVEQRLREQIADRNVPEKDPPSAGSRL